MRARFVLIAILAAASAASAASSGAAAGAAPATHAAHAAQAASTLTVIHCPTRFGIKQKVVWPRSVLVARTPSSTRGLVAYSNSQLVLIGPAGMSCSGVVAADGGESIAAWPPGHVMPRQHAHYDGLTLWLDPACAGCRAADACPFFTALASALGFPCTSGVPAGEQLARLSPHVTLFEDPPGVAGSGWPSGGPNPANGVVGVAGSLTSGIVYRSTCTLAAAQHQACTISLNDVIARYG